MQTSHTMRPAPLTLLPALALTGLTALCVACGGQDSLPTGSWHPHGTTTGSTGTGGSGSSTTGGGTGDTASSGGSSSGSTGTASGGGSSGGDGTSSGSGSGSGTASSGSSSGGTSAQPPTNLIVTLDQSTVQVPLMDNTTVHVSVAPNGYSGPWRSPPRPCRAASPPLSTTRR